MSKQKVLTLDEARAGLLEAQTTYNRAAAPLAATIERRQRIVDALSDPETDPDDLETLKRDGLRLALEADAATGQLRGLEAKLAAALLVFIASSRAATNAKIHELDSERRQARQLIEDAKRRQSVAASKVTGVAMIDSRLEGYMQAVQRDPGKAPGLVEHAISVAAGLR